MVICIKCEGAGLQPNPGGHLGVKICTRCAGFGVYRKDSVTDGEHQPKLAIRRDLEYADEWYEKEAM